MENRKKRIIRRIVSYIGVMIFTVIMAVVLKPVSELDYSDKEMVHYDTSYSIYQYRVHNHWPKWTPFYVERYGLINNETGVQTEALFADELRFNDDGCAWDYAGHFVDTNGNCVLNCEFLFQDYYNDDNPRKYALEGFKDGLYLPYLRYDEAPFLRNYENTYGEYWNYEFLEDFSSSGLMSFAVLKDNCLSFGFFNSKGEIVIPPTMYRVYPFDDNGYAIVLDAMEGETTVKCGLIDSNGTYVLDPVYDSLEKDVIDGEVCYRYEKGSDYGILNSKLEEMH